MAFLAETLKKSDIDNKFSVPIEWVREYWPNIGNSYEANIRVKHQENWHKFVLSTRSGGSLKPEFKRKDWQNFVKQNGLKKDDIVHFGKREGEDYFTIIIERKLI